MESTMVVNWYASSHVPADVFTFEFFVGPSPTYNFKDTASTLPTTMAYRPFKRRRALSDVDGSSGVCKKKRRLRLQLITSRLSLPFSAPASNIVNRGISKIANWAKDRTGRTKTGYTLRQAAIMNRVRQDWKTLNNTERRKFQVATFVREPRALHCLHLREVAHVRTPPLTPSPLGLSNYDALDLEDMKEHDLDDDGMPCIYSDFGSINTATTLDDEEYEYLDDLDRIPHHDHGPVLPSDERVIEMLRGADSPNDIRFVRLGMG